jgi:hypothetical protein
MFLGHFAVAFAAKRAAPSLPLGTLFLAAQLADLVWPTLVLLGVESFAVKPGITAVTPLDFIHYPWSHSLVALAFWGAVLGGACVAWRRRAWPGLVLFALVVSHWLLDVASHRPDVPLTIDGDGRYGLGLWHSVAATLAVEALLFAAGIAVYLRSTRALDRTGQWALAGLIAFLAVAYLASVFGPPPPDVAAVAWTAQSIWLLVAWGYWIDRHRRSS